MGPESGGSDRLDADVADARWLRQAFAAALRARDAGNAPFGAVLVAVDGTFLLEAGNTELTTRDVTAHAELNAVRMATARFDAATLAGATLYASTEPCPMCAAAIFWSGIGRVVFGLRGARLREALDPAGARPILRLTCAEVLAAATRPVEVIGPLLEDEALGGHTT
jgi:tRNA(Arg) A34 adenosine deaminase TadA